MVSLYLGDCGESVNLKCTIISKLECGLPLVHCNIDNMVGMVWFGDILLEQQKVDRLQPQQPKTDQSEYYSVELVEMVHNIRHHLSPQLPVYNEKKRRRSTTTKCLNIFI